MNFAVTIHNFMFTWKKSAFYDNSKLCLNTLSIFRRVIRFVPPPPFRSYFKLVPRSPKGQDNNNKKFQNNVNLQISIIVLTVDNWNNEVFIFCTVKCFWDMFFFFTVTNKPSSNQGWLRYPYMSIWKSINFLSGFR